MVTEIQLDSLIRTIKGGWITIEQVPEELLEVVSEKLNVKKDKQLLRQGRNPLLLIIFKLNS